MGKRRANSAKCNNSIKLFSRNPGNMHNLWRELTRADCGLLRANGVKWMLLTDKSLRCNETQKYLHFKIFKDGVGIQ